MIKSVWFLNDYAGSPLHGMTLRHYYLAQSLKNEGIASTIITASFSHLLHSLPNVRGSYQTENIHGTNYVWVKVPRYERSFSKGRVLKWAWFFLKLFLLPTKKLERPDVIIVSPSAPFPILPAWLLARRFGAKLAFEVRDIWPLTLVEIGGISAKHPFVRLMGWFERFALKKSDYIISNLHNYKAHVAELGIRRDVIHIPNGVILNSLQSNLPSEDEDRRNTFTVGYAGKLGKSNALEDLIEAAKHLKENRSIKFVLVGAGECKKALLKQSEGLPNVEFREPVSKAEIPKILASFDACYIGLRDMPLFRFGTSPNKLFDYLLAAKPVVYAVNDGRDLVGAISAGVSVKAGDPKAIADGILKLFELPPHVLAQMGQNGLNYVKANHDYQVLAQRLIRALEAPASTAQTAS